MGRHAVDRAANANDFSSVDAGVDCRSGIVTHHAANKLHAGGNFSIAIDHVDGAVGVFQIAVGRPRAKVDPAADVVVTKESRMLLVGPRLCLSAFDFSANFSCV